MGTAFQVVNERLKGGNYVFTCKPFVLCFVLLHIWTDWLMSGYLLTLSSTCIEWIDSTALSKLKEQSDKC